MTDTKSRKSAGGHPPGIRKTGGKHPSHIPKVKAWPIPSKAEAISKIPFFESLAEEDLSRLEPFFLEYKFKRKQYLLWEGDPPHNI